MDLVTYLGFDGRCEEAFHHYEKVLRGKMLMMMRMADAPLGIPIPEASKNRIMHARLEVAGRLLMGGDAPSERFTKPQGFNVNIMVDDLAEAERIFRELAEGGSVQMPLMDTFWARRFGMLVDRFDVPWMVNCPKDMGATEAPLEPFSISRTFKVSRELLWQCFTDVERLKLWWGPKGVKIGTARMDLRPGGTFLYSMQLPDGTEMWGRFLYREIVAPERTVHVNSFSDPHGGISRHPLAPQWPIEMLSSFAFADAGAGHTRFTVSWTPLYPTPDEEASFKAGFASMQQGWSGTFENLEAYLATL